jgi:hypothetical protein
MIISNFLQGLKQLLDLTLLSLYKNFLMVEPAEVALLMGIIYFPWCLRIVYGFMSDNVKIFGSKRRGHLLLNTGCCIFVMCMLIIFSSFGKYFITACIFISQINMAYNDTVIEALTVQAANHGVTNGSESLNTISEFSKGIGGIFGALIVLLAEEHEVPPI